jgi:hypothetical protein
VPLGGAQFYIADQLGFRKIVDATFMMGFLLSPIADLDDTERYFRALRRTQRWMHTWDLFDPGQAPARFEESVLV